MPNTNRQLSVGGIDFMCSSSTDPSEPRNAPIQNVELISKSTCPRTRAGINSSTAELMAAYSPPIPAPVRLRNKQKLQKLQENAVAAVAARYTPSVMKNSRLRPSR